jgi:hypothetical protein
MTPAPAWGWLVANGLLKDAVSWAVFTGLTAAFAWWKGRHLWREWREHKATQERIADHQGRIADLLDTGTPGGLADLVEAVKDALRRDKHHEEQP